MRIQHNIMAMNAYRNYNTNTSALSKNLEKLSSGYKINRAGDDAAGLAISEKMRAQITGLNAASKNVKDGISLVKTAEGAMQEIQDMLNRMDYLATQSANGTYDDDVDRANLQKEVDALKSEIDRIAESANFNGIKLLDGKTGLNGIEITKDVAGAGYVPVGDISFDNAFVSADAHFDPTKAAAAPGFTMDISGIFGKTASGATIGSITLASGESVTINVGSKAFKYVTTATGSNTETLTLAQLASKVAATFNSGVASNSTTAASATRAGGGAIGNLVFHATAANDGTIKFTYKGINTTNAAASKAPYYDANKAIGTGDVGAFNALINGNTHVTATIAGGSNTKHLNLHGIQDITEAKAADANTHAGITVDFTKMTDLFKEGNTFKIDDKEYTISLEKSGSDADTIYLGNAVVAASATAGAAAAAYAKELVRQLTTTGKETSTNFEFSEVGAGKLHIDHKASLVGVASKPQYYTEADLKAVFSAKNTNDVAAKGNGVTINFADAKAGAKLVIGEGSAAKTFTLVDGKADATKNEISLENAPEELKAALGSTYAYDPIATGAKSITIRTKVAATADEATAKATKAPVVGNTGLTLQIGDTSDSYNQLQVKTGDLHTAALNIANLDISNPTSAAAAIQTIKDAINSVSSIRGDLGAVQNRLEHTANNLSVMAENIQDAESTIRDTDVAEEMMAYTKNNILIQSAQAMLAQANAVPQGVLQLLG